MGTSREASMLFLVVYLLANVTEASMGNPLSAAASVKSLVGVPAEQDIHNRIEFVKSTLSDRLKYVRQGKRMADFQAW